MNVIEGRYVRVIVDGETYYREIGEDLISCTGCTNNSDNTLQFMKIHGVR